MKSPEKSGAPKGARTPVTDVRGQCPRPLDDGSSVGDYKDLANNGKYNQSTSKLQDSPELQRRARDNANMPDRMKIFSPIQQKENNPHGISGTATQ